MSPASPHSSSNTPNTATIKPQPQPQPQPQTQTQWSAAFSPSLLLPHPDPRKFTRNKPTLTRASSATTVDSRLTSASTATTSKSSFASQGSSVSAASFVAAVGASVKTAAAFGIGARDADGVGLGAGSWKKMGKKKKGKGNGNADADAGFGVANSPPRLKPLDFEIGSGKLDLDADAFVYQIHDCPDLLHPSSASPSLYHNDNNYRRRNRNANGNEVPESNYYSNDDDDDEDDKDNSNILINDTDNDRPPPELDPPARLALLANSISHTHRYTDSSSTITPSTYTRKNHNHHHHKHNHCHHHHSHHSHKQHGQHEEQQQQQQQKEAFVPSSPTSARKLKKRPPLPPPLVLPSSSLSSSFPRPREPGLGPGHHNQQQHPYAYGTHHPRTPVLQASRSQPSLRLGTPSPVSPRSGETETGSFVIVTPPTPVTPITSTTNVSENLDNDKNEMKMKNKQASGANDAKRTASLLMRTFSLRSVSSVSASASVFSGGLVGKRIKEREREIPPPLPPLPGTPTEESIPTTMASSSTPSEITTDIAPASALPSTTSTSHDVHRPGPSSCSSSSFPEKGSELPSGPGGESDQHAHNAHSHAPADASRSSCGPMITIDEPVGLGAGVSTAVVAAAVISAGGRVIYRDNENNENHNVNVMDCRNANATANVNANVKEGEKVEKNTSEVGLGAPVSSESSSPSSSSSSSSTSSSLESGELLYSPSTSTTLMSASASGSGVPQHPPSSSSTPNPKALSSTGEVGLLPLPSSLQTASPVPTLLPSTSLSRSSSSSFAKWRKWTTGLGERRLSASASASADRDVKGKEKEKEKEKNVIRGEEGASFDSGSGRRPRATTDIDLAETQTEAHPGKHQHDGDDDEEEEEGQNKQKKKRKSSLSIVISPSLSSSSKKHGHARSMSDSTFRLKTSPGKGEENSSSSISAMTGKAKPKFILGCESDVEFPLASGSGSGLEVGPSLTGRGRPPLLRRNAGVVSVTSSEGEHPAPGLRRWTLASAITDEAITDEGLVRELERMREVGEWELNRRRKRRRKRGGSGGDDGDGDGEARKGEDEFDENEDEGEGEDRDQQEGEEEDEDVDNCIVWDMGREIWDGPASPHSSPIASASTSSTSTSQCPAASSSSSTSTSNNTAPASWLAAQRALLTCRELILTERHYLTHLETLLASQTQTPPPPLMLRYAVELICASRGVLALMEREPSVRGIASAFLEREEEVCAAYVRWCGVVGGWFVDLQSGQGQQGYGQEVRKKKSRVRMVAPSAVATLGYAGSVCHAGDGDTDDGHLSTCSSAHGHCANPTMTTAATMTGVSNHNIPSHPLLSPLKRTVSTWRRSMPSITSLGLDGGVMSIYARREREKEKEKERDREREDGVGFVRSPSPLSNSSVLGPGRDGVGAEGGPAKGPVVEQGSGKKSSTKPLAVRELAILPTQRVMRYVLLYRDLLTHTPPTSASRVLVERAVEAACRIAEKCDRAQGNAAFIQSSSPPNYQSPSGKESGSASASSSRSSSRRQVKDTAGPATGAAAAPDDDGVTTAPQLSTNSRSPAGLSGASSDTTPSSSPATSSTSTSASTSTSSSSSSSSSSQILTPPSSIPESPAAPSSSSSPSPPLTDTMTNSASTSTPRANKNKSRRLDRPTTADSSSRRTSLMAMSVAGFGAIAGGWGRLGHGHGHVPVQQQARTTQIRVTEGANV